ncbi:MAG: hypothetical protein ABIY55_20980 [Kofleriaceae bacterium]
MLDSRSAVRDHGCRRGRGSGWSTGHRAAGDGLVDFSTRNAWRYRSSDGRVGDGTSLAMPTDMTCIDVDLLSTVYGGMRWEGFRRSTNIEDRRPPEAIAEDNAWMASLGAKPPGDAHVAAPARPADVLRGAR